MSPAPHRVRRQSWRIRAGSAAEAFALRRELREALEGALLPAFEEAFDRVGAGAEVIRIARLELRLRVSAGDDLAEVIPRLIRRELDERLSELVGSVVPAPTQHGPRDAMAASAADRLATLLHYLRTGALPWPAAGDPPEEAVAALRATCRAESAAVAGALRREPDPEPFCFRVLQLLGEAAPSLVEALSGGLPEAWRRALARLLSVDGTGAEPPGRFARVRLAAAILSESLLRPSATYAADLAAIAAERLPAEARAEAGELVASLAGAAEGGEEAGRDGRPLDPRDRVGEGREGGGAPERSPPRDVPAGAGALPALDEDFPTVVSNAGLVLLHPFIIPLLEHTGIAGAEGIPEASLPRAAALLHHAATGRFDVHEFELGLVKLLLGLAPDAPLPVAEGLVREREAEEVEALLRSVTVHWNVLKNTSPEGLRTSFLQRVGLLRREKFGWTLRVEPAAFDVLLDHLPWSLSVVKLPWMPEPIHTEWATR